MLTDEQLKQPAGDLLGNPQMVKALRDHLDQLDSAGPPTPTNEQLAKMSPTELIRAGMKQSKPLARPAVTSHAA